jgi:aldose sugar dehydrogenase
MNALLASTRSTFARMFTATAVVVTAACAPRSNDSATTSTVRDSSAGALPASTSGTTGCGAPLETRAAEAPQQKPSFQGQTRGCSVTSNVAFDVVVLARGLQKPWSVEPMPNGDLLVTEKPGRLRIVSASGQVSDAIAGVPAVDAAGQGGLLDVELSPDFAADRTIYFSFSEPREGGNGTSVARAILSTDRSRLEQVRVIFRAMPTYNGRLHYGSRVLVGPDRKLYITLGERSDLVTRPQAQDMNSHLGKIVRINTDGTIPQDNPFVGRNDAKPEIWSVGHRNVQAAAFDPSGRLWEVEHGTRGGDELNLIEKGKNYGWPVVAYGVEYSRQPIPNSATSGAGMEQPVYYWDPVIAPSGAQFYTGNAFPAWRNSMFVGALKEMRLVRLEMRNNRVSGEEHLLTDRKQRIRDVRQGPDGALYLVTDQDAGELWKITPRK